MFALHGNAFQSLFTLCENYVNSTAADMVYVDVINGTAQVMFKDGSVYNYKNVSRRAILMFINDKARSFGKFINNVLTQSRVDCSTVRTAEEASNLRFVCG